MREIGASTNSSSFSGPDPPDPPNLGVLVPAVAETNSSSCSEPDPASRGVLVPAVVDVRPLVLEEVDVSIIGAAPGTDGLVDISGTITSVGC